MPCAKCTQCSLKQTSQLFHMGLSHITIMIMIGFTGVMIIVYVQMERATRAQPCANHLSPPRQQCRPIQRWPYVGMAVSTMGQCRNHPHRHLGVLSQPVKYVIQDSASVHFTMCILVRVCDPTLRVYAFVDSVQKFNIIYRTYHAQFTQWWFWRYL